MASVRAAKLENEDMNPAHLHLILAHAAPTMIYVTLFVLILSRFFPREQGPRLAALILAFLAAGALVLAANSGEEAVEELRYVPEVVQDAIEPHEEMGELLFPLSLLAAFLVLIWYTQARKTPETSGGWTWWAALLMVLITVVLATWTANLGGAIRHPESQPGWVAPEALDDYL